MRERIDMGGGDVAVVGEIIAGIERRRRIAAFAPAELIVVGEGIDARSGDIAVVRQIAPGVEPRVRVAPFVPTERAEVRVGVDMRVPDSRRYACAPPRQVAGVGEDLHGHARAVAQRAAPVVPSRADGTPIACRDANGE
jgi:hypothetical protein